MRHFGGCVVVSLWLERSKASTCSLVTSLQNSYSCPLYHITINRRRKVLSVEKGITTAQSLGTRWESAYLSSSPHFTYPWMSLPNHTFPLRLELRIRWSLSFFLFLTWVLSYKNESIVSLRSSGKSILSVWGVGSSKFGWWWGKQRKASYKGKWKEWDSQVVESRSRKSGCWTLSCFHLQFPRWKDVNCGCTEREQASLLYWMFLDCSLLPWWL